MTRFREESGSALIVGVIILMIAMMLGTVVIQAANVETHQTGLERNGENAFNLAESGLDAEVSLLEQKWPASSTTAFPVCTQASTASSTCPQGSLSAGYNTTYAGSAFASPTWSVQVIDDDLTGVADSSYYSDSILTSGSLSHWDSNADNKLWVRASATIRGRTRTLVAQVSRQSEVVWLPQNVMTSGGALTSNNGNKILIEANDSSSSGLTGSVDLRCGTSSTQPVWGNSCAGWDPKHGQLDPASAFQAGYTDPITNYQTLTNGVIEQLRESAQSSGTYYAAGTCPPEFTGGVLFIENANCSYTDNGNWNSDTSPGAIVVAKGSLTLGGGIDYFGVVYLANGQGSIPHDGGPCTSDQQNAVFTVQGSATVNGGLFVDKCGTVTVGSAHLDLQYDTKAFGGLHTYEIPSIALSTFRVLGNGGH